MSKAAKKQTVLIVEDEPIVRESLHDWLSAHGYQVATAENGEQALQIIKQQSFGVVIIDLRLPDMDGNAVLEKAREYRPDLKCIIITAYPSEETTLNAMKLGAEDYIVKPFDPQELEDLIRELLGTERPEKGQDLTLRGSLSALVSEWKKRKSLNNKK